MGKGDFLPEDLISSIDEAKGVKKVNQKLVETSYKEAVKSDENLSTLRLKIWLLSKQGDWVEAGTWGFSLDKMTNIADFVRDIVLSQIEDISSYIINGSITVKFSVVDATTDEVQLQNTIKIAVPKDLIKQVGEVKKEVVKEKVEEGIWEGLEKFVQLNKQILDSALQAKEIEKQSLVSILKSQLEAVNQKMAELQQKILQSEGKSGEAEQIRMLLSFMTQLQEIRNQYEQKIMELIAKQYEMEAKMREEMAKQQVSNLEQKIEALVKVGKQKDRTPEEITKFTYELLKTIIDTTLKKEREKDPIREVKEIAQLIKELKDKDTGEDIKDKLSQTVIELTQKKLAEDPLEDLAKKVKFLKNVLEEINGGSDRVKEELKSEIEQLKNLIMTMQMQNDPFAQLEREEHKDPLEKLEEEAERLGRIYEKMERLFGKREPVSKSVFSAIKEILSSPTITELVKVLVQGLIQAEQIRMQQQMAMPPMAYGYIPQPPVRPVRRRVVKRSIGHIPQQAPQPTVNPNPQIQPPLQQPVAQQVGSQQSHANNVSSPAEEKPQTQQNEEMWRNEIRAVIEQKLAPVVKSWFEKGKRGGKKSLKTQIVNRIVEVEKETSLLQRIFMSNNHQLLFEFRDDIDNVLIEMGGFTKEEAETFVDEVIKEAMEKLVNG